MGVEALDSPMRTSRGRADLLRAISPVPLALTALALASCTPQPAENAASGQQVAAPAEEPVQANPPTASAPSEENAMCDADKAQFAVGQPYSDALAEQARAAAGAKVVRQLLPGQAITMEFNAQRLNLESGGDGRVVSVRCG